MNKLSDWKWAIDYSQAVGQKDAFIVPALFLSRSHARTENNRCHPKGKVVKIKISVLRKYSMKVKFYAFIAFLKSKGYWNLGVLCIILGPIILLIFYIKSK